MTEPSTFDVVVVGSGIAGLTAALRLYGRVGRILVVTKDSADAIAGLLSAEGETPIRIGEIEPGRGVKSQAKGKGEAEAVRYSAGLKFAG